MSPQNEELSCRSIRISSEDEREGVSGATNTADELLLKSLSDLFADEDSQGGIDIFCGSINRNNSSRTLLNLEDSGKVKAFQDSYTRWQGSGGSEDLQADFSNSMSNLYASYTELMKNSFTRRGETDQHQFKKPYKPPSLHSLKEEMALVHDIRRKMTPANILAMPKTLQAKTGSANAQKMDHSKADTSSHNFLKIAASTASILHVDQSLPTSTIVASTCHSSTHKSVDRFQAEQRKSPSKTKSIDLLPRKPVRVAAVSIIQAPVLGEEDASSSVRNMEDAPRRPQRKRSIPKIDEHGDVDNDVIYVTTLESLAGSDSNFSNQYSLTSNVSDSVLEGTNLSDSPMKTSRDPVLATHLGAQTDTTNIVKEDDVSSHGEAIVLAPKPKITRHLDLLDTIDKGELLCSEELDEDKMPKRPDRARSPTQHAEVPCIRAKPAAAKSSSRASSTKGPVKQSKDEASLEQTWARNLGQPLTRCQTESPSRSPSRPKSPARSPSPVKSRHKSSHCEMDIVIIKADDSNVSKIRNSDSRSTRRLEANERKKQRKSVRRKSRPDGHRGSTTNSGESKSSPSKNDTRLIDEQIHTAAEGNRSKPNMNEEKKFQASVPEMSAAPLLETVGPLIVNHGEQDQKPRPPLSFHKSKSLRDLRKSQRKLKQGSKTTLGSEGCGSNTNTPHQDLTEIDSMMNFSVETHAASSSRTGKHVYKASKSCRDVQNRNTSKTLAMAPAHVSPRRHTRGLFTSSRSCKGFEEKERQELMKSISKLSIFSSHGVQECTDVKLNDIDFSPPLSPKKSEHKFSRATNIHKEANKREIDMLDEVVSPSSKDSSRKTEIKPPSEVFSPGRDFKLGQFKESWSASSTSLTTMDTTPVSPRRYTQKSSRSKSPQKSRPSRSNETKSPNPEDRIMNHSSRHLNSSSIREFVLNVVPTSPRQSVRVLHPPKSLFDDKDFSKMTSESTSSPRDTSATPESPRKHSKMLGSAITSDRHQAVPLSPRKAAAISVTKMYTSCRNFSNWTTAASINDTAPVSPRRSKARSLKKTPSMMDLQQKQLQSPLKSKYQVPAPPALAGAFISVL